MEISLRRILIVDDSPEDRATLQRHLEKIQPQNVFCEAETGAGALELCRSARFDCILLSLRLPDMNGVEFLREIKRAHGAGAFPVIALGGSELIEDVVLMVKEGAHDYLVKSKINGALLNQAIAQAIEEIGFADQAKRPETDAYRLAAIVESSADAIITRDFDGIIVSWNKAAERMFGYTAEEIIGQSSTILFPPEMPHKEEEITAKIKRGEHLRHYETRRTRKDGAAVEISLTVSPIKNNQDKIIGVSEIAREITEQKNILKSLRESEEKFRALTQATTQAVWESSESGRKIIAEWWADLTGQNLDNNQSWLETLHPDDRERASLAWAQALENKTLFDVEYRIRNKLGEYIHFAVRGVPVFAEDGNFRQWIGTFKDISKRKRAEEALRESEERFRHIADAAPVLIWIADTTKDCTWFNKVWLNFTGRTLEQETGDGWAEGVHPQDLESCRSIYSSSFDERQSFSMEYRRRRSDGEYRWLIDNGAPRFTPNGEFVGYIGSCTDLSEYKKVQADLIFEKERFEKIVKASPGLIHSLRISPEGIISYPYVSPSIVEIYGFSPKDVEKDGKVILDRIDPEDAVTINDSLTRSVLTMSVWRYAFRYQHPTKGQIWIEGSSAPIHESDGSITWHGILDDVTERKINELQVKRLNESLEQIVAARTAELNSVNKELEAFSYSVSHDLRAPLRALDGFSLALLEDYADKLDAAGQNYLNRVRNASKQMARLIDDLLLLARVTRGEIAKTEVNLSEIVESIAEKLIENQPRENIVFEIEKNIRVSADERLIKIALENLLGNAYKFTSKCDGAKISFGQRQNDSKVEYFVTDNGAGFDMAYADKLFGAFQRLHSSTEFEGTGIGLATVQRVIRRHDGQIRAEGQVGSGASFYFTL